LAIEQRWVHRCYRANVLGHDHTWAKLVPPKLLNDDGGNHVGDNGSDEIDNNANKDR
jgi:hypothetical protein